MAAVQLEDPGFNMPITNSTVYRKIYKGVLIAAGLAALLGHINA